jgi:ADP-ribose pyrophosphatase YjhB (NUDIX family)
VPCVGAVIKDPAGRMLLILRGHEPGKGLWSVPGGRIEPGETDQQAVVREVREETGLEVVCGPLLGIVERPGLAGAIVDIRDYVAFVAGGIVTAGDDAADARWVTPAEADAMDAGGQLTSGLLAALRSWGALPPREPSDPAPVRDLGQMLAGMRPRRHPGRYVFAVVAAVPSGLEPVMTFSEAEGLTVVADQAAADHAGLAYDFVAEWITLTVHSALDGVGLTAAVSSALAAAGISCNIVAAVHHDHLFVPAGTADRAISLLAELAGQ